jgi:hypothetical protein
MLIAAPIDRRPVRRADRAAAAALDLQARPPLRPAAHARPHAADRRRVPLGVRRLGPALRRAERCRRATDLGFMVLPNYRAWVVVASLVVCFATWFVIEKTRLGAYLRAGTENPRLVEAFGINVPLMVTLTYAFGAGAGGLCRRAGRAGDPGHAADGAEPHHRGVRRGGDRRHGLDHGRHPHRPRPGRDRRASPRCSIPRLRRPSCSSSWSSCC